MADKTPEQLTAEAAAATKAAADAAAAAKAAAADAKAKEKAAAADAKAKEKAAAKAKAEQDKADKKTKAAADKAAAKKAKEDARMPEQNGIRRPRPEGKCGQAWAIMDRMSAKLGSAVAIADLMVETTAAGMNPNMVRSNYATWRKFNKVEGRVKSQAEITHEKALADAAVAAADAKKKAEEKAAADAAKQAEKDAAAAAKQAEKDAKAKPAGKAA